MAVGIISSSNLRILLQSGAEVSLVDARPAEDYNGGHLPGAIQMNWEDWCEPAPSHLGSTLAQPGYWGVVHEGKSLSEKLSRIGLANEKTIVVYADGPLSKGRDGRLAWMLSYYGANNVLLLDGGWRGWLSVGGAVEHRTVPQRQGCFAVNFDSRRRVTLEQLKQFQSNGELPLMLDTRTRSEFEGRCFDYMPRMGRVPSSLLLPFNRLFNADGSFVSRQTYLRLLPPEVGPHKHVVAYCEVGVRAATASILHEMYAASILPVFDGSMMEWGADPRLPVECPLAV